MLGLGLGLTNTNALSTGVLSYLYIALYLARIL